MTDAAKVENYHFFPTQQHKVLLLETERGKEAVTKTLLANRWSPGAVSGNEKLSFGKLGPICNNTQKNAKHTGEPIKITRRGSAFVSLAEKLLDKIESALS